MELPMACLLAAIGVLFLQVCSVFSTSQYADSLENADLDDVSARCLQDSLQFFEGAKAILLALNECRTNWSCSDENSRIIQENMFAAKQLDAFGKIPAGILEGSLISSGSYRECVQLKAHYKTHYCYARALLNNDTSDVIASLGIRLAVCMPESCSAKEIPKILDFAAVEGIPSGLFVDAVCVPSKVVPTAGFWIFMSFMAVVVIWAIAASTYEYAIKVYYPNKGIPKSIAMDTFLAFSFYDNSAQILDVSEPKKGILKSLPSIRFITMTWVACGHTLWENTFSDNLAPIMSMWDPLLSTMILNAFLSVDTFFLLSGILVSYLFFKTYPSRTYVMNPMTWITFYLHRYLRLTPPMIIFVGFYTVVLPFTNGPYSATLTEYLGTVEENVKVCQDYWWRILLYINNFYVKDGARACYNILWYLALDMQFYLIAPIFLVALYFHVVLGLALIALICVVSIWYVYFITYWLDIPATMIGEYSMFSGKINDFFSEFYEKPWARVPPYIIGIAVGYLTAHLQRKPPKFNWFIVIGGWIAALIAALLCVFGPYRYIKGDDNWNPFTRGTYSNFSRIGWALAVSWVIIANHFGWGGPIATFMENRIWQPLGRLSYCAYIVHSFVIHYVFNLEDRPAHFISIWQTYVHRVIPIVVISYIFAFIWSCLFEVSFTKIDRMFIGPITPRRNLEIRNEVKTVPETAKSEENGDLRL